MEEPKDRVDVELEGKSPARVTVPGSRAGSTAAARKKAPAKKAPAKKAPAKKAPAKKAPVKKAPVKKAPVKKAPVKKAPAKTKPASKEQPAPVRQVPTTARPEHPRSQPRPTLVTDLDEAPRRWAICASVTEELLNDLVLTLIGEGVGLEPLDTAVALPGMGEVDVRLALTITGGSFDLRVDDGGRARIVVHADGDVSTRSVAYDAAPSDDHATPSGVPTPPAPIPVRVEALVTPFLEIHDDRTVSVGLDLADAELVSLSVDPSAPTPDGVDPAAWAGILSVFSMLFGVLGEGLFDSLGEHVGSAGTELPAEVGETLVGLGVRPGRADLSIASGLMTVGLPAAAGVEGRAMPAPVAGRRVGLAAASSAVDAVTQLLLLRAAGDLPLPFELEVDLGEQRLGGRLRQTRLLPESFPDLRSSLRTEVRPRLTRGRLELAVQAAWVELPPIVPSVFNLLSKRVGELVSLSPIRVRFPSQLSIPLPDTDDGLPVRIDDLRVTEQGVAIVVALV